MFIGTHCGKKSVYWNEGERPTLQRIIEIAKVEFPDIPYEQLVLEADLDNDGKSICAGTILHQL